MSTAAKNKKYDIRWYINTVIVLALFIFVRFLPPFGQITESGMAVLGVFLGMLYGWLTVGFAWPSMLGMLFLGLTQLTTVSEALTEGWGNINACILVIMGFALAAYLDQCKLTDAMAAFFLTRKVIDGRPLVLVGMIFLASFVLGAFVNLFAGIFVMWAIMYKVSEYVGYEKRTLKMAYLLGAVIFAAQIGSFFLPFHASAIMYSGFLTQGTGVTISYLDWMLFQGLLGIVFVIFYPLVGKFILRLDFSDMANVKNFEYLRGKKLSFEQKFGIFDLVLMIAILMAPDLLPEGNALGTILKTIGVPGAFIIAMVIPAIVKIDGKPLMDIGACTKTSSWDVVWLLVATIPIASAMQSEDCGIINTVVSAILGLCGDMNWIVFMVITTVALGLATQISHNLILAIVLFGPLALVCQNLGGNPAVWFMVNVVVNLAAFVTPAGSAPSALYHGNSEWISSKEAYLMGAIWLIMCIVLGILYGVTIGEWIF